MRHLETQLIDLYDMASHKNNIYYENNNKT